MDFIMNLNWELVFTIFLAVFSALLVRDVFWWVWELLFLDNVQR